MTLRKLAGLLIFFIVLWSPVHGAEKDAEFDLFIVPTLDDRLDSWLKVPAGLNPTIHIVDRIYPNQPFSLRLLFRGYSLSPQSNAHITYDVQFIGPDNKPTADKGSGLLGYHGPVKSSRHIIINQQLLRVYFDDSYPAGEYGVQIVATDELTGKRIAKTGSILYAPFEKVGNFVSFDFYSFWIQSHYRQPDVAKAIFGLLQFIERDRQWLGNNLRVAAFARRLLKDNPWLWPHLLRLAGDQPETRNAVITLAALDRRPLPELAATFSPAEQEWHDTLQSIRLPAIDGVIRTPEQVDVLWGEYFATGHLKPAIRIVRLLKPFALAEPPVDPDAIKDAGQAAFWSLVEYGRQGPLLIGYYSYLIDHGQIPAEAKTQLRLVLELINESQAEEQEKG